MMRKPWAALGLVAALLVSPAPNKPGAVAVAAETSITLKVTKEPLSEVARLIAQQAGVPIRVEARADTIIPNLDLHGSLEKILEVVGRFTQLEVRKEGEGYVLAPPAAPEPAAPAPTTPPIAEVVARVKPCVALVVAYITAERARAQGTAFAVGPDGLLATNAHVVQGASAIQVAFAEGQSYYAAVAALDEDRDLAVLRVAARFRQYVELGDSDRLREGDSVALTAYPLALELLRNGIPLYASTAKATVNAIRPATTLVRHEPITYIQIDAPVNPGSSGAPLFRTDTGEVVGVVQAKLATNDVQDSGLGFALPSNLLRPLLRAARDNPVKAPSGAPEGITPDTVPLALSPAAPAAGESVAPSQRPAAQSAVTRPYDLLPPPQAHAIPEPNPAPGVVAMHAPGGKLLADPARPRLYVADFGGNSVAVLDTESGKVLRRVFTGSKPRGLALAADGRSLYVANSGGSEIVILDLETLQPTGTIPLSFRPFDLALGPGDRLYATAAGSVATTLRALDTRKELEVALAGVPLAPGAILAAARAGQAVFAAERSDAPAALFRSQGGSALEVVTPADGGILGSGVQDLALSPDGQRLYVASTSLGYVTVLDAATLRPLGQLDGGGSPTAVVLSPDGQTAYVCDRKGRVDRFDTATFLRAGTLALPEPPLHAALSPDGKRLFVQLARGVLIHDTDAMSPAAPE